MVWARLASISSRGCSVSCAAQVAKALRRPWTVSPVSGLRPRRHCSIAMLDSCPPFCAGNTSGPERGRDCRSPTACTPNATRCGRYIFIRSAGTFQTFVSKSISFHRAPSVSIVRAAVRSVNNSAYALVLVSARMRLTKAGTSAYGVALRGVTFWMRPCGGSRCDRAPPTHRAGLSPLR